MTKLNRKAVSLVKERLPDRSDIIDRVCRECASFRELCEDYQVCVEALRRFDRETEPETAARREEYATLEHELATEIQKWLDDYESRTS